MGKDKRFSGIEKDSRFSQLEARHKPKQNAENDSRFGNIGKSIMEMASIAKDSKDAKSEESQSQYSIHDSEEIIDDKDIDLYQGEDQEEEETQEEIQYVDGEESTSLAIVNMDWDHVKASDIYVVLHSFLPATGKLEHVRIFSSNFGRERLAEEAVKGPRLDEYINKEREKVFAQYRKNMDAGVIEYKNTKNVPVTKLSSEYYDIDKYFDANTDEAEMAAENAIRRYELDRMKYAFAVAKFNTVHTASNLYSQLNGVLFERSSCVLDLRVIMKEDEQQFLSGEKLTPMSEGGWLMDECYAFPQLYSAKDDFEAKALQKSRPELTWDQTDPARLKITTRKLSREEAHDWANDPANQYIAFSDDENSDPGDQTDYLRLLTKGEREHSDDKEHSSDGSINSNSNGEHSLSASRKNEKGSFFISFEPLLKGDSAQGRSLMTPTEQTPFQRYLEQRSKKKERDGKAQNQAKRVAEALPVAQLNDRHDNSNFSLVLARKEKMLQQKISDAKMAGDSHKLKRLTKDLQKLHTDNPWIASTAVTENDILADDRFAMVLQNGQDFHLNPSTQEYREGGDLSSVISAQRKVKK